MIADQQRHAAIDSAATALKALTAPNLAAGADAATIQEIASDEVKSKGVTSGTGSMSTPVTIQLRTRTKHS